MEDKQQRSGPKSSSQKEIQKSSAADAVGEDFQRGDEGYGVEAAWRITGGRLGQGVCLVWSALVFVKFLDKHSKDSFYSK